MPPITTKQIDMQKMLQNDKIKESISNLKQELVETPVSKNKYKTLARDLKDFEKRGFAEAMKLVFERMLILPKKVHWKILLDLADFAKRESKFSEAKILFKLISYL